jgi:hypothetical protein
VERVALHVQGRDIGSGNAIAGAAASGELEALRRRVEALERRSSGSAAAQPGAQP